MNCQYVCRYKADKVERMKVIKRLMENKDLKDFMYSNYRHFNWGTVDKCKFGVTCDKVTKANIEFKRLSNELDELLSAYIEKPCHEHYYDILNLLRGYFPSVYKQFEMAIIRKGEK
jgi:hypothetical protein